MADAEWVDVLKRCGDILDAGAEALSAIRHDLDAEESVRPISLHHLYDMAEDMVLSDRIRRAESNLAWRR